MVTQYAKRGFFLVVVGAFLFLSIFTIIHAASTIGTNLSTTGTLTTTADSATAVRFQNAAGTNFFIVDTTNSRVGVGAAPGTTFEVQGTASASYFLTGNTIQVGGFSSAAYSRFGTGTATASAISTTNDLLISGNLEVDLKSYFDAPGEFQGTASASYFLTGNTIQVGGFASVAYNRFGTVATTHSDFVTTTNDVVVVGDFEVDGKGFFDGTASVASDFEAVGYASASSGRFTTNIVVGNNVASSSTAYYAEFGGSTTGTVSLLFGGSGASAKGTCFQMKNTAGNWVYLRIKGTTSSSLDINTRGCHP